MKWTARHTAYAVGTLLFCFGMAIAAMWDLPLNEAVYAPQGMPVILMETHGFAVLYLPTILWLFVFARRLKEEHKPIAVRALLYVLAFCGAAVLVWYGWHGLVKRAVPGAWVWNLGVFVLAFFVCSMALYRGRTQWRRVEFALRWGMLFMIFNNIIINAAKLVWNRTRFDDMLAAGDFSPFTAWYEPFGNGGTSFPSGHTAAACGIFVLIFLCDALPALTPRRTWAWGICWAYIVWMAASRIIIGRHFLSDTLAAACLMTLLLLCIRRCRMYRAQLARLEHSTDR